MRSLERWLAVALMAAFIVAGAVVAQKSEKKEGPPKKGPDEPARLSIDDVVERIMSFDKNKDGKVTKDELPERMHHLIALGDVNKDGALDRDEIRKLATTLASAPREPEGRGVGFNVRQEGKLRVGGPGPGGPGPGFGGDAAGVVEDLKLSGKKKDQALAAVKAHEENVRKLMDKARADLLEKMKEILSEEELNDFKAALDRPRGPVTAFSVGPRELRKDGGEKKLEQPKK